MQGGILTPPFAIITYAVLLNYQSLPQDPAPGPAAAPAGDTSGPTPHSSARSGRSRWRPARFPRLLLHFLRGSEHRSMYSYVRLSIDRCTATYV